MTERSKKMLDELDMRAQPIFLIFLKYLDNNMGDDRYIVFEGRRAVAVQEAYYAQGRELLATVNELRKKAGLYLLRSERDNYIITWTKNSKHVEGFAMDVVPVDGAGNPTWDLAHYEDQFKAILHCGKKSGLVCGADWKPADWPHYEIKL